MADAPGFDANAFGSTPPAVTRNRAVTDVYEPGSTFKLVTVAGVLSDRLVTPRTTFPLPYSIQVADRVIHDAEQRGTETMSVARILAQSSNVGAITLAEKLGRSASIAGCGASASAPPPASASRRECRLRPEARSVVRLDDRQRADRARRRRDARADGGRLRDDRQPRSLGAAAPRRANRGNEACAAADAPRVEARDRSGAERDAPERRPRGNGDARRRAGLQGRRQDRDRAEAGLARRLRERPLRRLVRRDGSGASRPRLVVLVTVDEPHGAIWGGVVAAPAFAQIAAYDLQYSRVPPDATSRTTR